jgi:ammonia channel protein AmtB
MLTQNVRLYDGFPPGSGVIQINDDDTFVLTKLSSAVGGAGQVIFTAPLREVAARGSGSTVTFTVGSVRKRVDFSLGSQAVRDFGGLAGEIAGGVMVSRSGVAQVIAALRKGGASVRYRSYIQRLLLIWAIAIGFVVVIIVIIAIAALTQP